MLVSSLLTDSCLLMGILLVKVKLLDMLPDIEVPKRELPWTNSLGAERSLSQWLNISSSMSLYSAKGRELMML